MIRKRIVFKGRVQGVGFRFTAIQIGTRLGLTGWVKNEYDGSVLMEVQGEDYKIAQLIKELKSERFIRVDNYSQKEIDLVKNETQFGVKGWY